ncbi:hypothetical protein F5Y11DRAFT_345455 [Daldinia sp. FL1419]|nr:hypothetical protein F5Y11DRAFT_345455 [Daldinia sp. FL1419]
MDSIVDFLATTAQKLISLSQKVPDFADSYFKELESSSSTWNQSDFSSSARKILDFAGSIGKELAAKALSFATSIWKELGTRTNNFTELPPVFQKVLSFPGSIDPSVAEYIALPHVRSALIVWAVVFTFVTILGLRFGFGRAGVAAGSMAAAIQSAKYGAFTPASGIFATLTSLAMLGIFQPLVTLTAAIIASIPAAITFVLVED